MSFLCEQCDRSIIQSPFEHKEYLATMQKKNDKSLYIKIKINNVTLDDFDKILNDYITTHKKKLILVLIAVNLK